MKRLLLYLDVCLLLVAAAGLSAISARDPDGAIIRVGMVLLTVGASLWLPWPALLPAALATWAGPNYLRSFLQDYEMLGTEMLLELPAILGLAATALMARGLTQALVGPAAPGQEIDEATGLYKERLLVGALEAEVARSRRFRRTFTLVYAGLDEIRQRFDYRTDVEFEQAMVATATVLRSTRAGVDRVFLRGTRGFALLLPETGPGDIEGMVRRLSRVARRASPAEGEPGGPLPMHFGVTFYPHCATTVDDLMKRAEVAVRIAESKRSRLQTDSAEAPELPSPEELRRPAVEEKPPWLHQETLDGEEDAARQERAAGGERGQVVVWPWGRDGGPSNAGAAGPVELSDAISELGQRVEETLALIRTLKAG